MQFRSVIHRISVRCHSRSQLHLVYFGSDRYSLAHLEALTDQASIFQKYRIQHVVTANDDTPVALYCAQTGLDYSTWPRGSTDCAPVLESRIKEWQCHLDRASASVQRPPGLLGLVISFGRFLPTSLIGTFKSGCINIHPSLLPRWRGPCPLLHTLLAGDEVSGVSVIQLPTDEHSFDSGPILAQHAVKLDTSRPMSPSQLGNFLVPYSIRLMFQILGDSSMVNLSGALSQAVLAKTRRISPTNAPRPTNPMGHIDWENQTATDIVRLWHSLRESAVFLTSFLSVSKSCNSKYDATVRFLGKEPLTVPLDCASETTNTDESQLAGRSNYAHPFAWFTPVPSADSVGYVQRNST
ncbi:unnamed protein product [Echinostoma caproni]|uniref:Formyl_trans_N domain-containing protein n=1 Tax=Echinostoma caproni TaxID=27848 RepID=A0A183AMA8_9TREM|nr:unnamed protein product [Echinostoma caproni]